MCSWINFHQLNNIYIYLLQFLYFWVLFCSCLDCLDFIIIVLFKKNTYISHCITSRGVWCQFVSPLVMASLTTLLKWRLAGLSIMKACLPFVVNKWSVGETLRDYVSILFSSNFSPNDFSIHLGSFQESVIIRELQNSNFKNSIIPFTIFSWHSSLRRSFPAALSFLWFSSPIFFL